MLKIPTQTPQAITDLKTLPLFSVTALVFAISL